MKKSLPLIGLSMLLAGCSLSYGTDIKTEGPVPQDLRETPAAVWMVPGLPQPPAAETPWTTAYPKTVAQVFAAPRTDAKPLGTLQPRQPYGILEVKTAPDGTPAWVRVDAAQEGGCAAWVEAVHLDRTPAAFIKRPFEGVDYGPVQKAEAYLGNPRVPVKGVYVTINSVGSQNLERLIQLADTTEINAFVIDVKDDYGKMLFPTKAAGLYCPEANQGAPVKDVKALVRRLKEKNIYLIARIVAFKTPNYSLRYPERAITDKVTGEVYSSRDGLHWASAFDRQLWRYNAEVAKEAAEAGFNEIQFDYVRFPDILPSVDAKLDYKNAYNESKTLAVYRFLRFARTELEPYRVYLAADTFGWTASSLGDEGIGQHWESLSNVLDYNCPMMYPSHYGSGNFGLKVPDAAPYQTLNAGIQAARDRDANLVTPGRLRPWIQDFTAKWVKGHISYGPNEVRAQIQALKDNGIEEYLLWNATNRYTEEALLKE